MDKMIKKFKKENDIKLHQIYFMRGLYWYGENYDLIDLSLSYDEWLNGWINELNHNFELDRELESLEAYMEEEVSNAWEHYRIEVLKTL